MKDILYTLIFIIIFFGALFIILEPVNNKLEATCEEYNMTYVYMSGQNCLDADNVLHRISTDCPSPFRRGSCEITYMEE